MLGKAFTVFVRIAVKNEGKWPYEPGKNM